MRIYVASSWRNQEQPNVVKELRSAGHEVYDFRNPAPGDNGFGWSQIDPDWQRWSVESFIQALDHPIAIDGFNKDLGGMERAEAFVLVMPCGRSAHLEAGWAIGRGLPTAILLSDGEPELMYRLADRLCTSPDEVLAWLAEMKQEKSPVAVNHCVHSDSRLTAAARRLGIKRECLTWQLLSLWSSLKRQRSALLAANVVAASLGVRDTDAVKTVLCEFGLATVAVADSRCLRLCLSEFFGEIEGAAEQH